jgi:thiol-disulfide isomerase/thioredoxin
MTFAAAAAAAAASSSSSSRAVLPARRVVSASSTSSSRGGRASSRVPTTVRRRAVAVASASASATPSRVVAPRRSDALVVRAGEDSPTATPPPPDEGPPGKAIAGAGFAVGVALFAFSSLGGAPTLASLEKDAIPLDVALRNGRPTVLEFYADWCEVCKESAPVVYDVEKKFGEKINFVMLNIDNTKWGGEIDQYGVDGIPHIVFLDDEGKSEGMVVGKFPKQVLEANVAALSEGKTSLPYAKVREGVASPVSAPAGIAETPGSAVDDPRGGAVSSADPRFHG